MIRIKYFLFLFLIVFTTLFAEEQKAKYVEGQILVLINPRNDNTIKELVNDLRYVNGKSTGLNVLNRISPEMNIYLLEFDSKEFSHNEIIQSVGLHPDVLIVQNNHIIEYRSTVPDDPFFPNQWQYINPGGNGGVLGADIDADLAWDITTGGVTPRGDTIVVCIVDDGIRLQHPDFGNNIWRNRHEIPGNGIDDDGNGYIDDARGWNADNNNDDITGGGGFFPGGGHGTPVAGIVGAKGNNGVGVAGVNWDVKLMIVVGGGNEAQTLAAYSYPLAMRKLYNSTNGEKGAFVVATNSSWGTDFGQPSQAPLWCAMYDTMGKYGILSAGATMNRNENVDIVGDLPSACPSPHLITVTNTGRNDIKVRQAAFGATTVDIGAPGEDAYTVSGSSSYGGFGGTSGATPHVAGAIALLYAAPCPSFADLYKNNPAQAALKAKEYIMEGGDDNASLQGITVSGKRLNLFGALTKLMEECILCPSIGFTVVSSVSENSATVAFSVSGEGDVEWFIVRHRVAGTQDWTLTVSNTNVVTILGLDPQTEYEYEVQASCPGGGGNKSDLGTFNTYGVSISNLARQNGILVYPNPSKDFVNISFPVHYQDGYEITITDITGKTIATAKTYSNREIINVSQLSSGIYLLRFTDVNGNTFTERIQKY
jgi:serine protease